MDIAHPIDLEIRTWLKRHVENKSAISLALGHGNSWLHKYINGEGHATIDDLVRIAGLLVGLNLPVLTEPDRKLLKACQALDEGDRQDVLAYAEHRARLARSKESSAPVAHTPSVKVRKVRGTR